jgi:glycosyltransferase involved in cell wall biosynthesis
MNGLSIIIPAYNSSETIRSCIESVICQLEPEDQLIVVDDGSEDDTGLIARSYPAVSLFRHEKNLGAAAARNTGASLALKNFLLFLDSDVLLSGDVLTKLRETLLREPDLSGFTAGSDAEELKPGFFTDYKNIYMSYIFARCDVEVNFFYGSFCGIRKSEFISWPTSPALCEDSHLGYLLSQTKKKIKFLHDIKIIHLKKYSIFSLFKNDFNIAASFMILFLRYNRWRTLLSGEKFGHTSKTQKWSVVLAVLGVFLGLQLHLLSLFIFFIWIILNIDFFIFLKTKRGSGFLFKSFVWTYIDHLIYAAGILKGVFQFVRFG